MDHTRAFVGLDVHKDTIAVAVADGQPGGEVRFWGKIENTPERLRALAQKLAGRIRPESSSPTRPAPVATRSTAGSPTRGLACRVVAPSLIPRRPGDRVKNDHRDAMALARLPARRAHRGVGPRPRPRGDARPGAGRARRPPGHQAGEAAGPELPFALRPDLPQEALERAAPHLAGRPHFPHPAQQVAFQSYLNGLDQACSRREQLEGQIRELVPGWSLAGWWVPCRPARRRPGDRRTVAAEVGEISRFENPKQLMAFLGLAPGEHSSGQKTRTPGDHQGGQRHRPVPALRGGLELPAHAQGRIVHALAHARGGFRRRLRTSPGSAAAALEAVPAAARQGEEVAGRDHRGGPRAGGLHVVDRPRAS